MQSGKKVNCQLLIWCLTNSKGKSAQCSESVVIDCGSFPLKNTGLAGHQVKLVFNRFVNLSYDMLAEDWEQTKVNTSIVSDKLLKNYGIQCLIFPLT